jgi:glycosyltransferase involved in cell wall biosynthesis
VAIAYSKTAFGGTEQVADYVNKQILPKAPKLNAASWVLIPGGESGEPGFSEHTIVWCHLPASDIKGGPYEPWFLGMRQDVTCYITQTHWHKQNLVRAYNLDPAKVYVISNGIDPAEFNSKQNKPGTVQVVYNSAVDRGFKVLNEALEHVTDDNFQVALRLACYCEGCLAFLPPKLHPSITVEPRLPREDYGSDLSSTHILAYPSTWPETFCLSTAEALSAGVRVVTTDSGALPETTLGLARIVETPRLGSLAKKFGKVLDEEIALYRAGQFDPTHQISMINERYSWGTVEREWMKLEESL